MTFLPHPSKIPSWRRETKKPALIDRLIHVDLKGPKIPFNVLTQFMELLARWGASGIVLEYEHRIPSLPLMQQFPADDRYTLQEIAELRRLCARRGIEIIPLVQCLGHVEYLHRIPGTVAMMENPEYPNQLCPSNAKARKYLLGLVDTICALHPEAKRIHVGLDEAHQLGRCPVCKKRAKALGGPIELYLEHTKWITTEFLRRGKVPMLWGDMFLGHGRDKLLSKLDPLVQIIPWDYGCTHEETTGVLYKGSRPCKAMFRHDYTARNYPSPLQPMPGQGAFADDLSAKELQRLGGLDPRSGMARSFSQGRLLASLGIPVIGACAADASASGAFLPDFPRGMHNCIEMVRVIKALKGRGVIATSWARGHSFAPINCMWPLALHAMANCLAAAWTGKASPADLKKRSSEIASGLGMPARLGEWSLDDVLSIVSNPPSGPGAKIATLKTVFELLRNANAKGAFAETLLLGVEAAILWQELIFLQDEARWWNPNRKGLPRGVGKEMQARLARILKDIDILKPRAMHCYTKWVGEKAAFECWWTGLYEIDRNMTRQCVKAI